MFGNLRLATMLAARAHIHYEPSLTDAESKYIMQCTHNNATQNITQTHTRARTIHITYLTISRGALLPTGLNCSTAVICSINQFASCECLVVAELRPQVTSTCSGMRPVRSLSHTRAPKRWSNLQDWHRIGYVSGPGSKFNADKATTPNMSA